MDTKKDLVGDIKNGGWQWQPQGTGKRSSPRLASLKKESRVSTIHIATSPLAAASMVAILNSTHSVASTSFDLFDYRLTYSIFSAVR